MVYVYSQVYGKAQFVVDENIPSESDSGVSATAASESIVPLVHLDRLAAITVDVQSKVQALCVVHSHVLCGTNKSGVWIFAPTSPSIISSSSHQRHLSDISLVASSSSSSAQHARTQSDLTGVIASTASSASTSSSPSAPEWRLVRKMPHSDKVHSLATLDNQLFIGKFQQFEIWR
jgi:hypothetical protein